MFNQIKTALSALGQRAAPPAISWLMKTALARPGRVLRKFILIPRWQPA